MVSFPIPLRILFAAYPELLAPVLQIIHRVVASFLIKQAGLKRRAAETGAVTLIQRFGSAANFNIHLHGLVLDGVYRSTRGEAVFQKAGAPTSTELQGLLLKIIARLMRVLTRQGYLVEEQGMTYLADIDADSPLRPLQAASCTYRVALGPRAGQKVLSLQTISRRGEPCTPALCANAQGFSSHAAVCCGADQRKELERLYHDDTTHVVMSPLEFMQRLAALVPTALSTLRRQSASRKADIQRRA